MLLLLCSNPALEIGNRSLWQALTGEAQCQPAGSQGSALAASAENHFILRDDLRRAATALAQSEHLIAEHQVTINLSCPARAPGHPTHRGASGIASKQACVRWAPSGPEDVSEGHKRVARKPVPLFSLHWFVGTPWHLLGRSRLERDWQQGGLRKGL